MVNRARIVSTDGTTSGPTASMTWSACPSSSVVRASSLSSTARCSGPCSSSTTASESPFDSFSVRKSSGSRSRLGRLSPASESSRDTSSAKYDRSHGTAVNCSRWVASCRHTHSPKSYDDTSRACWAACTLGATSSSRPSPDGPPNGSYCPSTRPPR